jgi:vacuolar-type H+-ATPase subunit E/Vma4
MDTEIKEKTENVQSALSRVIEQIREQLKNLDNLRKNEKLWGKIDYINMQVEQTKEISAKYNQLLDKNPNAFDTVYHAIAILSKNTDIFNDKVEIVEAFFEEMEKKIDILRDTQLKILAIVEKMPAYIRKLNQDKIIIKEETVQ